jgi:hypothetical protein
VLKPTPVRSCNLDILKSVNISRMMFTKKTVLYCTVLYCTVLCTVLYCTLHVLYCTVLYCTAVYRCCRGGFDFDSGVISSRQLKSPNNVRSPYHVIAPNSDELVDMLTSCLEHIATSRKIYEVATPQIATVIPSHIKS